MRAEKSALIAISLSRLDTYRRAHRVAAYWPMAEEVDTKPIIAMAIRQSKSCFLPVINTAPWRSQPLLLRRYCKSTRLAKNRYGIEEPSGLAGAGRTVREMDMVIVPMVGFNRYCDRIGMGGGYYDRVLGAGNFRPVSLVGVAFDCQLAEFDPQPQDVPMDLVVTESRQYSRRHGGHRQPRLRNQKKPTLAPTSRP